MAVSHKCRPLIPNLVGEIRFPYQPTVFLSANTRIKNMTVISVICWKYPRGTFL
jgi:hypothetical protein